MSEKRSEKYKDCADIIHDSWIAHNQNSTIIELLIDILKTLEEIRDKK